MTTSFAMAKTPESIAKRDLVANDLYKSIHCQGWEFISTKRNVSIFAHLPPGQKIQQVKATSTIDASVIDIVKHVSNPYKKRNTKKDPVSRLI
jgi:hypothetical protein